MDRGHAPGRIVVADDVADALAAGRPVLGLDTLLLVHGLPRPRNRVLAEQAEAQLRDAGVVPAFVGMLDGRIHVGSNGGRLATFADGGSRMRMLGAADLAPAAAAATDGALSPGAAAVICGEVGIGLLATIGLVGVTARSDDAADLDTLARSGVPVVSGGALPPAETAATSRRCRATGMAVVGVGTDGFPGCYREGSAEPLGWVVDTADEAADVLIARRELGSAATGILLLAAIPDDEAVPARLHDRLLRAGRSDADDPVVRSAVLTGALHAAGQQRTLQAHTALQSRILDIAAHVATATSTVASS